MYLKIIKNYYVRSLYNKIRVKINVQDKIDGKFNEVMDILN
jgi:hypothetical protein